MCGRKVVRNAVHNAFLNILTTGTPFLCVPPRNDPWHKLLLCGAESTPSPRTLYKLYGQLSHVFTASTKSVSLAFCVNDSALKKSDYSFNNSYTTIRKKKELLEKPTYTFSTGLHASCHVDSISKQAITRHYQSNDPSYDWTGMQTCVYVIVSSV